MERIVVIRLTCKSYLSLATWKFQSFSFESLKHVQGFVLLPEAFGNTLFIILSYLFITTLEVFILTSII